MTQMSFSQRCKGIVRAALVLALLVTGASAQLRSSGSDIKTRLAGWFEFTDKKEGFSVYFPVRPEDKFDKFRIGKNGPELTRHFYAASGRDEKTRYMVGSVSLPVSAPADGTAVISRKMYEQVMARLKESFEASMQSGESGCYLGNPKDVFAGSHRGREYKLEGKGCPAALVRMFSTARRFYVVASVGATDDAFLRSFNLLNSGERLIIE
jgi:hypothetical protein